MMIELISTDFPALGNHNIPEFIVAYIFGAALIIGAPSVFLFVTFMSAIQNTKGKWIGYKEYKDYGPSSLNEKDLSKLLSK